MVIKKAQVKQYFVLFLSVFFVFLFLNFVSAASLEVTQVDKGSVVISELNNPAVFDLNIFNMGQSDTYQIYSLVGVSMAPKGNFNIPEGHSTLQISAYPSEKIRSRSGYYQFEYELKGEKSGIFKDQLTIKIVPLAESVEISAKPLNPVDSNANVIIQNMQNTHLEDLSIKLSSPFFEKEVKVSLNPYENVTVSIPVNKENVKKLKAGPYVLKGEVTLEGADAQISGIINYLEKEGTSVKTETSGFIIRKTVITKTNEGNVPVKAQVQMSKDIISRLFNSFSIEPLRTNRSLLSVSYVWEKQLDPAEQLVVSSTTNYTIPFVVILLIVAIVLLAKIYSTTAVVVNKRVSFVKTRGGEFALKVNVHVKAKKQVNDVQIIDRLPNIMKLYEKFGRAPDRVDAASRRLFWNIGAMNSGEERVFSYVIYTTIKVVGRFELPSATAVFEKDGKTHEVLSNRTFFVSESGSRARED